ncbi:hypothetical protein E5206_12900 [Arthrobacter sp. PAMC25564]|uniref:hypothetical protein n=1 Tax=Arthrobacter sp. PAMC25564 TaxID=2565366 RepID=UPI0010A23392|nr:hypothetical protein [Arthrobacter sp. PAMC25564]QCB97703.1 hypothetical protein E5206_12900 [Arthrobacter sp. PAMC25564]
MAIIIVCLIGQDVLVPFNYFLALILVTPMWLLAIKATGLGVRRAQGARGTQLRAHPPLQRARPRRSRGPRLNSLEAAVDTLMDKGYAALARAWL